MLLPGDIEAISGIIVIGFLFGASYRVGDSFVKAISGWNGLKTRRKRPVGYK